MANFFEVNKERIDELKPLWEKFKQHHCVNSKYFRQYYEKRTFEIWKEELLKRSRELKIDLVTDEEKKRIIGYGVTLIDNEGVGEVFSLFVEDEQRGKKLGDKLVERGLAWLDTNNVSKIYIVVSFGNEKVLSLYERFGFYPRVMRLERK